MKTSQQVKEDMLARFYEKTQTQIETGSVVDLFTSVLAEVAEDIYQEIDNNRTPHIWSSLEEQQLDDTGTMLNLPRKVGELDANYRYRLMNWTLSNEASNLTAVNDALLLPIWASNIEFRPKVRGCGTAVCYVIPKEYTTAYINNALLEAQSIVEKVASPSLYVEYIVPRILGVKLQVYMLSETGDVSAIKSNIESKVLEYINDIPPYAYLQVGQINRIGILEDKVDYFNVMSVIINGETVTDTAILQNIDTKFLYDEIIWTGSD